MVEVFEDLGCGFEIGEGGGGFTVDAVDPDFLGFEDVGEDNGFFWSGVGQEFDPATICPEVVVETFEEEILHIVMLSAPICGLTILATILSMLSPRNGSI